MTLWLSGLVLGLVLGWELHWWLKLRPFVSMVEAKTLELQGLMEDVQAQREVSRDELLGLIDGLERSINRTPQ